MLMFICHLVFLTKSRKNKKYLLLASLSLFIIFNVEFQMILFTQDCLLKHLLYIERSRILKFTLIFFSLTVHFAVSNLFEHIFATDLVLKTRFSSCPWKEKITNRYTMNSILRYQCNLVTYVAMVKVYWQSYRRMKTVYSKHFYNQSFVVHRNVQDH